MTADYMSLFSSAPAAELQTQVMPEHKEELKESAQCVLQLLRQQLATTGSSIIEKRIEELTEKWEQLFPGDDPLAFSVNQAGTAALGTPAAAQPPETVTLLVGDVPIVADRAKLIAKSNFMQHMLEGDFAESKGNPVHIEPNPSLGISPAVVEMAIAYIQNDLVPESLELAESLGLYHLADMWQCESLQDEITSSLAPALRRMGGSGLVALGCQPGAMISSLLPISLKGGYPPLNMQLIERRMESVRKREGTDDASDIQEALRQLQEVLDTEGQREVLPPKQWNLQNFMEQACPSHGVKFLEGFNEESVYYPDYDNWGEPEYDYGPAGWDKQLDGVQVGGYVAWVEKNGNFTLLRRKSADSIDYYYEDWKSFKPPEDAANMTAWLGGKLRTM